MKDKFLVYIDPGTSMFKYGCRFEHRQYESEFESFFFVRPGTFIGAEASTLESPLEYAGLIGASVRNYDPDNITRESDFYTTPKFGQGIFYALADCLQTMAAASQVTIWLGLALPYAHMAKADDIQQQFTGVFPVKKADSRIYTVNIERVIIKSQGECVALDQIFRWQHDNGDGVKLSSERGRNLLEKGAVYIQLHGSNSFEQHINAGRFDLAKGSSLFTGTFDVLERLKQIAYQRTGKNLSQYELMYNVLKESKISFAGEPPIFFYKEVLGQLRELLQS